MEPPLDTILDVLKAAGKAVKGVGKIEDIFAHRGLTDSIHAAGNPDCIQATLSYMKQDFNGLCFTNLVDTDSVYGHRNDPKGFAGALEALKREREAALTQRKDLKDRLTLAALEMLKAGNEGDLYAAHLLFADHDTLLKAASELTKEPQAIVLLSCPKGEGRMLVFARGKDAAPDMAQLLRAAGARGGGKPDMAQGSAPDGEAMRKAIESVRQEVGGLYTAFK